jgi:hypothetical protein
MDKTTTDYITSGGVTTRADLGAFETRNVYLYVHDSGTRRGVSVFLSPDAADALAAQLIKSARAQRAQKP